MTRRTAPQASFDDQLVLFRYFLHELKVDSISALSEKLNGSEYEGVNESGNTYFYTYIARICQMRGAAVTPEKLRLYDENICRHTRQTAMEVFPVCCPALHGNVSGSVFFRRGHILH